MVTQHEHYDNKSRKMAKLILYTNFIGWRTRDTNRKW